MRAELQVALDRLERITGEVDREVSARVSQFSYSGSNAPSTTNEAQKVITEFFWGLFCPHHDIHKHWDEDHGQVWGRASIHLTKTYGNAFNALSIACTSVEGGLRNVLEELTNQYLKDQYDNQIIGIISDYHEQTSPSELVVDSEVFAHKYVDILPRDKTEGSAAYIRTHYFEILRELPFLIRSLRIR